MERQAQRRAEALRTRETQRVAAEALCMRETQRVAAIVIERIGLLGDAPSAIICECCANSLEDQLLVENLLK